MDAEAPESSHKTSDGLQRQDTIMRPTFIVNGQEEEQGRAAPTLPLPCHSDNSQAHADNSQVQQAAVTQEHKLPVTIQQLYKRVLIHRQLHWCRPLLQKRNLRLPRTIWRTGPTYLICHLNHHHTLYPLLIMKHLPRFMLILLQINQFKRINLRRRPLQFLLRRITTQVISPQTLPNFQ